MQGQVHTINVTDECYPKENTIKVRIENSLLNYAHDQLLNVHLSIYQLIQENRYCPLQLQLLLR